MDFSPFINNAPLDQIIHGVFSLSPDGLYPRSGNVIFHNGAWREWLAAPSQHEVFLLAWKCYAL